MKPNSISVSITVSIPSRRSPIKWSSTCLAPDPTSKGALMQKSRRRRSLSRQRTPTGGSDDNITRRVEIEAVTELGCQELYSSCSSSSTSAPQVLSRRDHLVRTQSSRGHCNNRNVSTVSLESVTNYKFPRSVSVEIQKERKTTDEYMGSLYLRWKTTLASKTRTTITG